MRGMYSWKAAFLSGMALVFGCATGGGGPSPTAVCQDRSRFGFPERLSPDQLDNVRSLVQRIGAAGAELIPISDSGPDLLNRREIAQALEREYPPRLRDQGVSGTAQVTLLVTENGRVEHVEVWESAGNPALDEAAERVALGMEFTGFHTAGEPTCYVTAIPVSFIRR